jgi:hypothetical protein
MTETQKTLSMPIFALISKAFTQADCRTKAAQGASKAHAIDKRSLQMFNNLPRTNVQISAVRMVLNLILIVLIFIAVKSYF